MREHWAGRGTEPFHRVVGSAVLSTLPRTVDTGLSTLVILTILLVLGGATLADFALALIVGIVAGTLSTIVVAASFASLLQRRWSATARARTAVTPTGKSGHRAPARGCAL